MVPLVIKIFPNFRPLNNKNSSLIIEYFPIYSESFDLRTCSFSVPTGKASTGKDTGVDIVGATFGLRMKNFLMERPNAAAAKRPTFRNLAANARTIASNPNFLTATPNGYPCANALTSIRAKWFGIAQRSLICVPSCALAPIACNLFT